jgi:CheY-like chemotaxis protein
MSGTILLAIPDLIFGIRIADAARALGYTPVDVVPARLKDAINGDVVLVVLDTGQPYDWAGTIRALKADPATASVPVLAYGSHVDVTASRAAVAAGVDRLVTRGKLMAELPRLLEQNVRKTGPASGEPS